MSTSQYEISETLGNIHKLAPAGYALGVHLEYTTPKLVFQTYPKAWLDHYSSNGLIMSDPMVAWGFENSGHLRWSDLEDPAGVMKAAAEYGMKFGIVVAVSTEDSRTIGGFARTDREMTEDEIAQIETMVQQLHDMTADTGALDPETVAQLKNMSVMVTHPGS